MKTLYVNYFASLGEKLNCKSEQIQVPTHLYTVAELRLFLAERNHEWQTHITESSIQSAVNQDLADDATLIGDGDEVAFFPPVTGG